MKGPTTYAEWVPLLKQFSEGDERDSELLPLMELGAISWSDGVAEKFAARCAECMNMRLNSAWKKFGLEQQQSSDGVTGMVSAIMAARKRLKPMVRFAAIKGFPEELRTYLQENLKSTVDAMQDGLVKDLQEKAKHSSRHGDVLAAVRKNPICLPAQEDILPDALPESTVPADGETSPAFIQKKKKLLF